MASTQTTYDITLNKDLFIDPEFKKTKNFDTYFPLKYSTIQHRFWLKIGSNARTLLTELLSIAYNKATTCITVDVSLLPKCRGFTVEMLLLELSDYGYLEAPKLKENTNLNQIKSNQSKTTATKKTGSSEPRQNPSDSAPNKTKQFISKYCDLFKSRYGSNPVINGKTSGIAKRLSESLGQEKSDFYLEAFFAMPDSLLTKNKHPLSQFEFKLNEITVFANSGKFTTYKQAQQHDQQVNVQSQIDRIKNGEL